MQSTNCYIIGNIQAGPFFSLVIFRVTHLETDNNFLNFAAGFITSVLVHQVHDWVWRIIKRLVSVVCTSAWSSRPLGGGDLDRGHVGDNTALSTALSMPHQSYPQVNNRRHIHQGRLEFERIENINY